MENKFELKNITTEKTQNEKNRYTLCFADGEKQEFITLAGNGELKETIKI